MMRPVTVTFVPLATVVLATEVAVIVIVKSDGGAEVGAV